jgi:hypothetical protein
MAKRRMYARSKSSRNVNEAMSVRRGVASAPAGMKAYKYNAQFGEYRLIIIRHRKYYEIITQNTCTPAEIISKCIEP